MCLWIGWVCIYTRFLAVLRLSVPRFGLCCFCVLREGVGFESCVFRNN